MKGAIVTGANGFVGSALVVELLNKNIPVCAIIHNNNRHRLSDHDLLKIISCDKSSISNLEKRIEGNIYDVFYDFAWEGSAGDKRFDVDLQLKNIHDTIETLKISKKLGCKRFLHAGSMMEKESIIATTTNGNMPGGGYIYGSAKATAHMMSSVVASRIGIDLVWPLITNAYGPGEDSPRLVNTTIKKCIDNVEPQFTSATQNYDFVYIDDMASAFHLIGEKGKPFNEYVIGSSNAKPLKSFLMEMNETIAPNLNFNYGSVPFTGINLPLDAYDCRKTEKDTGFKAQISFSEGCKRTLEYYKKQ